MAVKYYYQVMKHLVSLDSSIILLLFLLFSPSMSKKLIDLTGPFNPTAFGCLANQGFFLAIIRVYSLDNGGSIDPNGLQTIHNAFEGGFAYADGYMVICRNNDPISQMQKVIGLFGTLFSSNNISFWVKVEPNNVPGCRWENYTHQENCNFLKDAFNQFLNLYSPPTYLGIFTTRDIWNRYFGSTCTELAYGTRLWWANYDKTGHVNTNQGVDDFVPFGGWHYPTVKQIGGNISRTLCNNPSWHAYINYDYFP